MRFTRNCFSLKVSAILLIGIIATGSLAAQSNYVKGKVINYFTNEVIPFASVHWKKAGTGVITDSTGSFILRKTPFEQDTIILSYVGYQDAYHPYNPKKDT